MNKKCRKCAEKCKQSKEAVVIYCPNYRKK